MGTRVVERLRGTVASITLTRLARRYLTSVLLFVAILVAAGVFFGLEHLGVGVGIAVVAAIIAALVAVGTLFRFVVLPLVSTIEESE